LSREVRDAYLPLKSGLQPGLQAAPDQHFLEVDIPDARCGVEACGYLGRVSGLNRVSLCTSHLCSGCRLPQLTMLVGCQKWLFDGPNTHNCSTPGLADASASGPRMPPQVRRLSLRLFTHITTFPAVLMPLGDV